MAAAAKTHIAEKGGNPKLVTIVAFGGAGPVHAYGLAKKLGAPRLLVPPNAGVGSAMGFFTAPRAFDLLRSHKVSLADAAFADIEQIFRDLEADSAKILQKEAGSETLQFRKVAGYALRGSGLGTQCFPASRGFHPIREGIRFGVL